MLFMYMHINIYIKFKYVSFLKICIDLSACSQELPHCYFYRFEVDFISEVGKDAGFYPRRNSCRLSEDSENEERS